MAADSVVRLIVDATKAVNPLRAVNKATKKAEDSINKLRGAVGRSGEKFRQLEKKAGAALTSIARNAKKAAGKIKKAADNLSFFSKAALAAAAAAVTFKTAQAGINRAESVRRIKLLGRSYGEVAQLEALAAQNAQKFNLSQTEANQAIANVYARLRPLGVSLADINSTFAGFRTAAILGGATAQEASASFTQLSQALGSGALRGDEFRSVAEQAPLVLQAISDETGIAAGELKDYAKDGLLTSDIVIKALRRIETEGASKLTEALGGPAAAIKNFQNAAEDVAAAATEAIIPEMATAFTNLAELIRNLEGPIRFIGGVVSQVLGDINGLIDMATRSPEMAARRAIERGNLPTSANLLNPFEGAERLFGKEGLQGLRQQSVKFARLRNQPEQQVLIQLMQDRLKAMDGTDYISSVDLTKRDPTSPITKLDKVKKRSGLTEAEILRNEELKIFEAQDKINKKIEERNLLLTEVDTKLQFQLMLSEATSEEQRQQIKNDMLLIDNIKNYGAELGYIFTERQIQTQKNNADRAQEKKDLDELKKKQEQAAQRIAQSYRSIGDAIKTGVVDTLTAAVEGTKSLAEVASNTLKSLANTLLKLGMNAAFGALGQQGGIFGQLFGGERANGGTVTGGRSYVVGERGPELFTPGRTGSIAPNSAMGGNSSIVVNVDATGSTVQGDAGEAKQLGDAIGVAIRQELLKQKRPGGLLA